MNISFYFDPTCPFSWVTSRWLLVAKNERDINITWKPFSLALKNKILDETNPNEHQAASIDSLRFLRVALAAQEKNNVDLADLYTASGMVKHIMGDKLDDKAIKQILSTNDLPADLSNAADDVSYDILLQNSIDEVVGIVGNDVGVPIIVFENGKTKQGYFGPVLNSLPDKKEAVDLWDGLAKLATNESFYELKRSRPAGGPDTASTARC